MLGLRRELGLAWLCLRKCSRFDIVTGERTDSVALTLVWMNGECFGEAF
jgi:hypothetical protein